MRNHSSKRKFWRAQVDNFKSSGLSIRTFCANERLNQYTFGYWLDQFGERQRRSSKTQANFLPVVVKGSMIEANRSRSTRPDPKWVAEFLKAFLEAHNETPF